MVLHACTVASTLATIFVLAPAAHAAPGQVPPLGADFAWGVSASGFQTEGDAPDSNWSRYASSGAVDDPYRNAVDFRHRYRDDIALAADLGVNTYRVGIEWARVQPTPGEWDEQELAYYDDMLGSIRAAGMRPMITLDHWVYPGWAADRGGWTNPAMVADWLAYARRVVDRYAHLDPVWVTVNEPTAYIANEIRHGALPPGDAPAMIDRLVAVHRDIYEHIHRVQPDAQVTSNVAYIPAAEPALDSLFLNRVADRLDFLGLDYYYGATAANPAGAIGALTGEMWTAPLQSEGIYYALRHYSRTYPHLPLYVVETGMPTENGQPRPDGYTRSDALADSVYWVQRAKQDGIDVVGYNYWSLTDNYEWGSYAPRFGLYTVDALGDPSLQRRATDAVATYTDITQRGGVASDYLPTRPPAECSLVDVPASCTEPVTLPHP
ncbi:glycoside hydrolase family 1 protein [Rhodococcus sp. HNM0569]|nr:glycoside hydrolase family 1 protein [Rhodococcus sp. HNM0569]